MEEQSEEERRNEMKALIEEAKGLMAGVDMRLDRIQHILAGDEDEALAMEEARAANR